MKILVINSLYPPYHRGGAEVVVQTLVNELKKEHEVHVLTIRPWVGFSSLKLSASQEDTVTVYRFYPLNIFSFINIDKYPFWVRMIWHALDAINIHSYIIVRRFIRRLKPDLILTHNVKGIGYSIFLPIQESQIVSVHTMHDVQMIEPSGLIMWGHDEVLTKPSLIQWLTIVCSRWLVGSPQRVICPSRFLKELYEKYGFFPQSQREVISNPVPDDFFSPQSDTKVLHAPCRFLILGQVGEHKGIRVAIEALKLVPDLACILTIVGDGALTEYVKEQAVRDGRIQYRGRLGREEIKKELSETDYTIVPSLCYENSPLVIYESMAAGVPIIASRIGGVAELVDDGSNGYVVTSGNAEELARTLTIAAANPDYSTFSQTSREKVNASAVSEYVKKLIS